MHRDIKPQNIIVDHPNKRLKLIDWGLAEFYHPGEEFNVRVASRFYKAPELLVDYKCYDYSQDIWSLGCMFAGIIFQQEPFFAGKDNTDQLAKIAKVVGTDELYEYLHKYGITANPLLFEQMGKYFWCIKIIRHSKKPWKKFKTPENEQYATNEAIDLASKLAFIYLLAQMLHIDHAKRITAKEAMSHPYFTVPVPEPAKKDAK